MKCSCKPDRVDVQPVHVTNRRHDSDEETNPKPFACCPNLTRRIDMSEVRHIAQFKYDDSDEEQIDKLPHTCFRKSVTRETCVT